MRNTIGSEGKFRRPSPGPVDRVLIIGSWAKAQITIENIKRTSGAEVFAYTEIRNPGILRLADEYRLGSLSEPSGMVDYARSISADLVIVTTAGPLSRGNLGIGFAVPSNLAMDIAHAIIKEGAYRRPRIGIMLGQLSPARARKFLDRNSGVFIDFVFINSPAEKARLMPGDIIIKVDDNPVNTIREVQRAVIKHQLNEPVILTINREGEEKAVTVYTGQGSEYE